MPRDFFCDENLFRSIPSDLFDDEEKEPSIGAFKTCLPGCSVTRQMEIDFERCLEIENRRWKTKDHIGSFIFQHRHVTDVNAHIVNTSGRHCEIYKNQDLLELDDDQITELIESGDYQPYS